MRAAGIILAIVLPIAGAIIVDALWPRKGADRAFIFVLAIALGIALAVAFSGGGGGQYPPSVQRAIEQAQDVAAPPTPQRTALGCVWRGLLAAALVLVGVLVLLSMICGDGRFK